MKLIFTIGMMALAMLFGVLYLYNLLIEAMDEMHQHRTGGVYVPSNRHRWLLAGLVLSLVLLAVLR